MGLTACEYRCIAIQHCPPPVTPRPCDVMCMPCKLVFVVQVLSATIMHILMFFHDEDVFDDEVCPVQEVPQSCCKRCKFVWSTNVVPRR